MDLHSLTRVSKILKLFAMVTECLVVQRKKMVNDLASAAIKDLIIYYCSILHRYLNHFNIILIFI